MIRRSTFRSALASAAVVVAVSLLGGCAAQQSDYGADVAELLQSEVLEVSQLSANADFEAALSALTGLELTIKDARARGTLTEERYESILAATAQVRKDLEAAIAAQAPPPPAPEVEPTDDGDDDSDESEGKGEGEGKGNDGKGKGKGKGNSGKDD
jgi:hypothetical protein